MLRAPAAPYVVPFAVFLAYLALRKAVSLPDLADQAISVALLSLVLLVIARPAIDLKVGNAAGTVLIGILVFAVWIAPDYFFPGYRSHWLFTNVILGAPQPGLADSSHSAALVLALRAIRASLIVPILEELFWRAWLMRWLINPDFRAVPLGAWSARTFAIVAILFASEHGSYWDVGLAAGVVYNAWMIRTKSLGDLIVAHAVTNACLSAYVVFTGRWEYWV